MKSLHGFLHGRLLITFHGVPEFVSSPPLGGGFDANSGIPYQWYGLWMRIKGPHNYMVMAPDLCVKWSLGPMLMGSQVPNPTHASRSQHGGKFP